MLSRLLDLLDKAFANMPPHPRYAPYAVMPVQPKYPGNDPSYRTLLVKVLPYLKSYDDMSVGYSTWQSKTLTELIAEIEDALEEEI